MSVGWEEMWFGLGKILVLTCQCQCDAKRPNTSMQPILVKSRKSSDKRECNAIVKRSLHRNEHKNPISYSPNPNET